MNAIQKILVPTDFSAHADEAFRVAQALARAVGAEVILFHVAHTPAVVAEGGEFFADLGKAKPANLWDRFKSTPAPDPQVRVRHEAIIADRPSATHILEILDELGCDLIVMGTHGRSWLKQRLFGSVTEQVIRQARCPVMVVKAPSPAAHANAATSAPAQTVPTFKGKSGVCS